MSRVRGKDTLPEMKIRQALHALGFRFRLHRKDLPGSPDLVFPRRKKIVLVHGCFWHRHPGCSKATSPKSEQEFWNEKFARNVARDRDVQAALSALGWQVFVAWECETTPKNFESLLERLKAFLSEPS
jgi:DNA mismatch endonuclease (patch repair protein)